MAIKNRLIVFDVLRIVAISLIVISHINGKYEYQLLWGLPGWSAWIGRLFFFEIGNIGVLLFLFISGAVLELNKPNITTISSYIRFEVRRLLRLYPAYWMSLLFAIMLFLYSKNGSVETLNIRKS